TVGERGIGVQISGDGSTVIVYAGRSELSLLRKHLRQAEPKTELQLLRVDLRATTLVGRERHLSAIARMAHFSGWAPSGSSWPRMARCLCSTIPRPRDPGFSEAGKAASPELIRPACPSAIMTQ